MMVMIFVRTCRFEWCCNIMKILFKGTRYSAETIIFFFYPTDSSDIEQTIGVQLTKMKFEMNQEFDQLALHY